ncbi:unnamed protein product [Protopolystoma xenopodis]|uniref:Uncharacterized protein n=1 Tax=Protopolystoma xenopodis TaxID=117903 RepID=A0A3S5CD93_9PLAT|nr:unnamed protein product [Protopolystoma xenopodis]
MQEHHILDKAASVLTAGRMATGEDVNHSGSQAPPNRQLRCDGHLPPGSIFFADPQA